MLVKIGSIKIETVYLFRMILLGGQTDLPQKSVSQAYIFWQYIIFTFKSLYQGIIICAIYTNYFNRQLN